MRPSAPRHVRIRKLQKSSLQPILRQDELDSAEYEPLEGSYTETGVEKGEQDEYHLQAALAASSGGTADQEIPAPPAQESVDVDYDSLYPLICKPTSSYIRFSQTVEECTGCQYDMTSEDDVFLKQFHQKPSGARCTEDDFERIMEAFEDTAREQAPFASIDNTVIPFETMELALKQQVPPKIQSFGKEIYEYWKIRRQESGNTPLQPSLKFEKNQELDDGDPYVCFRRRDARQTRKTRNRDVQSTEKLKRLRKELEDGRKLIKLARSRETMKLDLLTVEKQIFEQRVKVKETKVKLGIKGDDEDLINQKPQKKRPNEFSANQRPSGPQYRLPGRPDGRPLDADLVLLSHLIAQKENALKKDIEEKSEAHRKWNTNHVDLTRGPLLPVDGQETSFRPATTQYHYLMTPPSSVTGENSDRNSPILENPDSFSFRYSPPPSEDESRGQPAYRRRMGRGGRLWIDRRGLAAIPKPENEILTDRWKYDQDDNDEQPVYEVDPHDLKALRFRASIPFPAHLHPHRNQASIQVARVPASSPVNSRAIAAPPQQQAPT